jgi:hypothetical protein
MAGAKNCPNSPADSGGSRPAPVLRVHPTGFCYAGEADPSAPGGIAAVYRELVADDARTHQIAGDVADALQRGRNRLVLTKWLAHLDRLADALCDQGHDRWCCAAGWAPGPMLPRWRASILSLAARRCR